MGYANINIDTYIDLDLDDISTDDLVDHLEEKGYTVIKTNLLPKETTIKSKSLADKIKIESIVSLYNTLTQKEIDEILQSKGLLPL